MRPQAFDIPGGDVVVFGPDPEEGDIGNMYVLCALGVTISVRVTAGATGGTETFVVMDPGGTVPPGGPLAYELFNDHDRS